MRNAVGIAVVAAGLTIGVLIWRACSPEATAIPVAQPAAEQVPTRAEVPRIQQPEVSPTSETLPPAPVREIVSLPDAEPVAPPPSAAITLLRVHLLAKEDRAPQKDKRLMLQISDDPRSGGCTHVSGHRGRLDECPRTDADGWAEFEVEPGRAHSVSCSGPEFDSFTEYAASALAQGEQREFEILVPTQDDVVLFGLLVDAENSKPVVDGTLQVEGDKTSRTIRSPDPEKPDYQYEGVKLEGPPIRADAEGRFQLGGKSWNHRFVNATAPGYARTAFPLALGHPDSTGPLEVRMWRSATLDTIVKDASGSPIMDASVDLTTDAYQLAQESSMMDFYHGVDPRWSAKTDAIGKASVVDLPPNVPLKLVVSKKGMASREEPEPLTLKAGERRTIQIPWGSGGVVQGQVLDGSGRPVANHRIWRMVSRWPKFSPVLFESYDKPAATTKTDDVGRFRFEDVAVGTWCVGIAPEQRSREASSGFPAYAEPVDMKAAGDVVELVLRVEADLFLRGGVVDPDGTPVPECFVSGRRGDSYMFVSEQTDESGNFKLGPLPSGTWVLEAHVFEEGDAPSLSVRVQAGTNDIVLQLRTGASIAGKVVNGETLEPAECGMTLVSTETEGMWGKSSSREGEFKFGSLLPGTYRICARDRAGFIGFSRAINLAAGQAVEGVEIRVLRGATLRLRYEGESKYGYYAILAGGLPIQSDGLEKGKNKDEFVPADAIEVRWNDWESQITKTQTLTIAVGEVRELVWDGKP